MEGHQDNFKKIQDEMLRRYRLGGKILRRQLLKSRLPLTPSEIETLMTKADGRVPELMAAIPKISGAGSNFARYLLLTAMLLPFACRLRQHEVPLHQIGGLIYESSLLFFKLIPPKMRRLMAGSFFSRQVMARQERRAKWSHTHDDMGGFVIDYVPGDGTFRYGINIRECGIVKFLKQQGFPELAPYICLTDWAFWGVLGIKATRTGTIAHGAPFCDFRYLGNCQNCQSGWPPERLPEWRGEKP